MFSSDSKPDLFNIIMAGRFLSSETLTPTPRNAHSAPNARYQKEILDAIQKTYNYWLRNCKKNKPDDMYPNSAEDVLKNLFGAVKKDRNAVIFSIEGLDRYNFRRNDCPFIARKLREFLWTPLPLPLPLPDVNHNTNNNNNNYNTDSDLSQSSYHTN
eukprot:346646_1